MMCGNVFKLSAAFVNVTSQKRVKFFSIYEFERKYETYNLGT